MRVQQHRDRNAPNVNACTLGELKHLLRASAEWRGLSGSQRQSYERAFQAMAKRWPDSTLLHGVMDDRRMRPVMIAWFQSFKDQPATANMHKAGLSKLLSFGVERGRLERNLALGIKRLPTGNRAAMVWTAEQVHLAIEKMPVELGAAVALAYATAQRQGDLLGLTWGDVGPEGVVFRPAKQQKRSSQRLIVPMYDELEAALALLPRRGLHVLTMKSGQPWNTHTFRHYFKEAAAAAGLPGDLHFHDLRGSALKAFADAGCSELEIRAVSGHSMKSLAGALGSYIDAWRSLALSAVAKRENANRTKVQISSANLNAR
jgi:integrase